jgi:hypothetical protein
MLEAPSLDQIKGVLSKYAADPIGFFVDCLEADARHIWPKMVDVAESVRDNKKTCVYAGHGVSKSYSAARIALWFLLTHPPATVVTTAPTNNQVEEILWREIRAAHQNARVTIGGNLTRTKLDFQEQTGIRWYATGFATRPDTVTQQATAFQGYHNENVLIVFDEAAGISPPIWKAAEALMTSGFCRFLAIGNPTSVFGDFVDCETDPSFNIITISVLDTPNYIQGEEVIPGVSGRPFEESMRNKYGQDSNNYKIRVLGQKPSFTEGTFYGKLVANAKAEGRIRQLPHDPSAEVYTFWDIGDINTAIWFAQFIHPGEIRVIDFYYDVTGQGLPGYATVLQNKPYVYGGHYAPHDIAGSNAKSFQTGRTTLDVADHLKIHFNTVAQQRVDDGIEAVRLLFPKCWFDKSRCREGLEALGHYRKKKNEMLSTDDKPVYYDAVVKDWACHPADAFRTLGNAYQYERIGGNILGYRGAKPEWDREQESEVHNLLGVR